MSLKPTVLDIEQGATYSATIELTDDSGTAIDLTGASVRGKIRKTASSSAELAAFTCAIQSPATAGKIDFSLTAAQTAALVADPSPLADRKITQLAYDIEVQYADASVDRVLWGTVSLSPEVTR